jgi:hypothetical protein
MRRHIALATSVAAAAAAGIGALVVTGVAPAAAKKTFTQLPLKTQVLIADRHAITAVNRSNAIRNRMVSGQTLDISALALVSRQSTLCLSTAGCKPDAGQEQNGTLAGAQGSLFAPIDLPDGSSVIGLNLRYVDSDPTQDISARLIRRSITGAYSASGAVTTVATVSSSGASDGIRTVKGSVKNGTVNQAQSTLYVEVFVPPSTRLQPVSVQVVYRPKPLVYPKVELP